MSITQIVVGGIAVIIVVLVFLIILKIKDIKRVLAREMIFGIVDKQIRDLLGTAEKNRNVSARARFLAESIRGVFAIGGTYNRKHISNVIRTHFKNYDGGSVSIEIRFARGLSCFVYPEFTLVLSKNASSGRTIQSFVSRVDRIGVSEIIPSTPYN